MPAVNARLQDGAIGHQIDLRRYDRGVILRMIALLNKSDVRLTSALTEALLQLDRNSFTVERLEALLGSVKGINAGAFAEVFRELEPELRDLVDYEAGYQAGTLRKAIPSAVQLRFPIAGVSVDQIYAAALSRPFQGRLLAGWAANVEAARMIKIRDAVRVGYVEGQTTSQIVQGIRGTRALNYADGLLDRSRREVVTVVQTALSHTAQTARAQLYKANPDLIKAVVWTSTLDNRTTPECAVRDGLQYTVDDHAPIGHGVPWLGGPGALHFNCRSVDVPVTASWKELGLDIADMPAGTRASMDGQVPGEMTYGDWFGKQSATRQDDIVGPVRGELFRAGKVTFDKFSDDKGKWLPLAKLPQP